MTNSPRRHTQSRGRALDGATVRLLRLLFYLGAHGHDVEIYTAAASINCDVNTVHQAAHRLREMGLTIETLPGPPWNQHTGGADRYRLDPDSLEMAEFMLEVITGDHHTPPNLNP